MEVQRFQEGTPSTTPIKILHLSDLHFDSPVNYEEVKAVVGSLDPDLVVFTGDLVNDWSKFAPGVAALRDLIPDVPRVAVLGNWDAIASTPAIHALEAAYRAQGFYLLVNQGLLLEIHGQKIFIYGWDELFYGQPRAPEVLPESDLVIHLMHEPVLGPQIPPSPQKTLAFAGHTHGGQVAFFGIPLTLPRGSGTFVSGRYELPSGPLFLSKGLGTSHIPLRLGATADVVLVEWHP